MIAMHKLLHTCILLSVCILIRFYSSSTERNAALLSDQNRLLRATHGTTIIHKSAGLVQYSDPKVVESRDKVS